jgi:hypothetical protein
VPGLVTIAEIHACRERRRSPSVKNTAPSDGKILISRICTNISPRHAIAERVCRETIQVKRAGGGSANIQKIAIYTICGRGKPQRVPDLVHDDADKITVCTSDTVRTIKIKTGATVKRDRAVVAGDARAGV